MSIRFRNRKVSLCGRHTFLNTHSKRHVYKAGKPTPLTACDFKTLPDSIERVFLRAVQNGDRHTVVRCLGSMNEKGDPLDINCTDLLGRSALMIAADNENAELVELMLKQEGIKIGDALLYAIQEGSYHIVEMIISHPTVNPEMLGSGWGQRMAQMDLESPEFSRDVSPVILAAICNQFEILQLLLDRGAWIEKPHQLLCTCDKCSLVVNKDSLRYSTLRINTYRALASPAWISLTNADPILATFKLSWELKNLALREAEFKEIYMELSEQCKQYACDFLDQCRSTEEVIAILNRAYTACDEDRCSLFRAEADNTPGAELLQPLRGAAGSLLEQIEVDEAEASATKSQTHLQSHSAQISAPTQAQTQTQTQAQMQTQTQPTHAASKSAQRPHESRRHSLAFVEDVLNDVMSGAVVYQDLSKVTLPRLRMAVKYEQRQFVINPVCQQLLNTLWYAQIPGWRKQSFLVKVTLVLGLVISLPFFALIYLIAPQSKIGKLVRSPFVKFLYHATSIALFLTLLCINFFNDHRSREDRRGPPPDVTECLILWFVLGFVWSEMKQVWEEGFVTYIRQWWNYVDIAMLSLFLCSASLRTVAYVQVETNKYNLNATMPRGDWPEGDPTFVAESMFAGACIFSFSRILFLFGLSQYLGPLQISLGRMLIDVGKFCIIFFIILTAFACGLNQLYCYNVMNDSMKHPAFGTLVDSYRTLLWALFGHFHRYEIKIRANDNSPNNPVSNLNFTERCGELLIICYLVVAMIILVNTLIAMITNSYDKIESQSDAEWKFARTKLWLDYFNDGSTLPPPFNIIISPKSVVRFARGSAAILKSTLRFCAGCFRKDTADDSAGTLPTTPVEDTPVQPVDTVVEIDSGRARNHVYAPRRSLPTAVGTPDNDKHTGGSRYCARSVKRASEVNLGLRSVREPRLSLTGGSISSNAATGCGVDRRYHEIMRKLVNRYILQRKKQYRDETVNEDDLLEIRQDISSLRYELRDDHKKDLETRRSDIDRLKRDLVCQFNDTRYRSPDAESNSALPRNLYHSSDVQCLQNELHEIRDELLCGLRELRHLVTEQRDSLPHRHSIDQTYASDSLLERSEPVTTVKAASAAPSHKEYKKLRRQPRFGFSKS